MVRNPKVQKLALWLLAIHLLSACGEEEGLRYEGITGQPVPLELAEWVPMIQARLAGSTSSFTTLVDTGSPLTIVSPAVHPDLEVGPASFTLEAFGLTIFDVAGASVDLFGGVTTCNRVEGLVGGDLLRWFRLGLDYQGRRAFLFAGPDADPKVGQAVGTPRSVPVTVLGGGRARLTGIEETIPVPATRIVLAEAKVEGAVHGAVVDTGASYTVISKSLLASFGGAGRPSLCCKKVVTLYGEVEAQLTRLKEVRLGPVAVESLPVLVWEDAQFFDLLSAEVDRRVDILLGGSFLRYFAVRVDYAGEELELSRYNAQSHVDPDEFIGPGISICKAAEGMVVVDVYKGTDAEKKGVSPGRRLVAVDGQAISDMSVEQVRSLMRKPQVGGTVTLTFDGGVHKFVEVEELLPEHR